MRHAYDADEIVRGGMFVILSHDGEARIERAEDEVPETGDGTDDNDGSVVDGVCVNGDGEIIEDGDRDEDGNPVSAPEDDDGGDAGKPPSDLLNRDLTSHLVGPVAGAAAYRLLCSFSRRCARRSGA